MSVDQQLVARAELQKVVILNSVRGAPRYRRIGRNTDKNRVVYCQGVMIDNRFDRSQSAAVVPAPGVGKSAGEPNDKGAEHEQAANNLMLPIRRRVRHKWHATSLATDV